VLNSTNAIFIVYLQHSTMVKTKQHIAHKVMALFSAITILLSTSGFSLYSHHCNHQNQYSYSIFTPTAPCACQAGTAENSCCKNDVKATCQEKSKKDCCTNKKHFSKLDIQTIAQSSTVDFSKLTITDVLPYFELRLTLSSTTSYNVAWQQSTEPPPPLSAKEFLSNIQVYII